MSNVQLDPTETMIGAANGAGLWVAPAGTAAPDLGEAFAAPWRSLGYASDDGVTEGGDTTTETFTPWQSRSPIRTVTTEKTATIAFTMWQLNQDTLSVYFDADVPPADEDGVYDFEVRTDAGGRIFAVAVDASDGLNAYRVVYPRATLETQGDLVLQKGAMVPLEVTLSALDDGGTMKRLQIRSGSGSEGGEVDPEALASRLPPGSKVTEG